MAACPADQAFGAEGVTPSASGTATDQAGNSAGASFGPIQIDKTAPTISAATTTSPNANNWYVGDVPVAFTCDDTLSGIPSGTCPPNQILTGEGSNISSSAQTVSDVAGNPSAPSNVVTVNIDRTPPTITYVNRTAPNGAGWNNSDVTVTWTCSDATSGVVSATVSQIVSSDGANQSVIGTCVDKAGNTASNTQSGINIDRTVPTISVTAPNAGSYLLNQSVPAAYSCSDGGSGVASCAGPVASGDPIDTASVGTKSFTVTAADAVGNAASQSVNYSVGYQVQQAASANASGKLVAAVQLQDASGKNLSAGSISVTALRIVDSSNQTVKTLNAPFTYTANGPAGIVGGGYGYTLSTGLPHGTYSLIYQAGKDPTTHSVTFTF